MLKAWVRTNLVEKLDQDHAQVFGFDFCKKEINRAKNMVLNHAELNPVFPLIERELNRENLFAYAKNISITPPRSYQHFHNNNCLGADDSEKGGCVQGGIGYWQKINQLYPQKYEYMANIEHELSIKKGEPVTISKDQRKSTKGARLFLKKCSNFPNIGCIDEIIGIQPQGFIECNGFCSTK